ASAATNRARPTALSKLKFIAEANGKFISDENYSAYVKNWNKRKRSTKPHEITRMMSLVFIRVISCGFVDRSLSHRYLAFSSTLILYMSQCFKARGCQLVCENIPRRACRPQARGCLCRRPFQPA